MIDEERDCDNIVEFRVPAGGTKEMYLARHFDPDFIYANRFQCATVPVYDKGALNNEIDNRREDQFTPSSQSALTKRGINNFIMAQRLVDEGRLINDRYAFQIPMNIAGRSAYYYFGDTINGGNTRTGLAKEDITKGYFGPV
jgi:hypothetical protein